MVWFKITSKLQNINFYAKTLFKLIYLFIKGLVLLFKMITFPKFCIYSNQIKPFNIPVELKTSVYIKSSYPDVANTIIYLLNHFNRNSDLFVNDID